MYELTEEQREALEAVDTINGELVIAYTDPDSSLDIERMPVLSITFASFYMVIGLSIPSNNRCTLPELEIYNSENNDRLYDDDSDTYESFYTFIKRKFIEIKEEINFITL